MKAQNSAEQLQKSYDELMALKVMPFFPVGSAFAEWGWTPTEDSIREFDVKAKEMGLEGVQWFSYRGAKELGYFPLLASLSWSVDAPEPTADCSEQETRIKELEAELLVAHTNGWNAGLLNLINSHLR